MGSIGGRVGLFYCGLDVMFIGVEADMGFGIFAGIMIALFWIGTSRLKDVLYERQPFKLYLTNLGYNLLIYTIMGAVLGSWH